MYPYWYGRGSLPESLIKLNPVNPNDVINIIASDIDLDILMFIWSWVVRIGTTAAPPPRPVNDYELAGQALRFQISNIVKSSIQFDFELPVAKRSSLVFSPNATYYDSSTETVYGWGLTLSHRKYSRINMVRSKNCSGGIYISIKGGYNYLNASTKQYTYNYSTYQSNSNSTAIQIDCQ